MNSSSLSQSDRPALRARNRWGRSGFFSSCIFPIIACSTLGCSMLTKSDLPQCLQDEDCAQQGLAQASCDTARQVCLLPQVVPDTGPTPPAATGGSTNDVEDGTNNGSGSASGQAGASGVVDTVGASVAWSGMEERAALGDSSGGSAYHERCADDEVLVGVKVGSARWADQLIGICQRIGVRVEGTEAPLAYSLEFEARRELPAHPESTTSTVTELSCPNGQAVVGVRISQQNYQGATLFVVIPSVWLTCGELFLSDASAGGTVRWRNAVELGPVSGSDANNTAWFASDELPDAQVAVGIHGLSGSWLDRIGLVSGNLAVSDEP